MKKAFKIIFMIPIIIAIALVLSLITMLLWNALMPVIFGLPEVTYLQALGLLALSKILFGSFGGGSRGGKGRFGRDCGPMKDKWEKMTPEEREKFMKFRRPRDMGSSGFQSVNPEA